ncbi:MAG: zinc-ribbon domain-containing protein [Planctomycetales bacterium]|nr:zinc-ribbon domain-containing protein [Planctomycetales bacterium]
MFGVGPMEMLIVGLICVLPFVAGIVVLVVVLTKTGTSSPPPINSSTGQLVPCPHCGQQLSPRAATCPKCGAPRTPSAA